MREGSCTAVAELQRQVSERISAAGGQVDYVEVRRWWWWGGLCVVVGWPVRAQRCWWPAVLLQTTLRG